MKYLDEYRDAKGVNTLVNAIAARVTQPWTLMEICGGQTHAILKYGLDRLLPPQIRLIHGPGCPVCVTAQIKIDQALHMAMQPGVIFCSFGDMLRVPGSRYDLLGVKAQGADVRMVYSPLDALTLARENPDKQVVFFAVGFETTAPSTAMALLQARRFGVGNFSVLVAHVRVPPAMEVLLSAPDNRVQGFLAAGHVCAVMGYWEYEPLAERFRLPIIVTGFEPLDILQGILACVEQLEQGRACVENHYGRAVTHAGNVAAQSLMNQVFMPVDLEWRGLGCIAGSGLGMRPEFKELNADTRFDLSGVAEVEENRCMSGDVLTGRIKPDQCPAFARPCTPEHPLGATMVSSEGACAAYYRYRR
ncbi:hydrogenase formation protein HypD [Candidatus Methylospira mobilis]|uniref:Hydrogenase maturation factor n=1 Tax=Candidatus Methylospira mobilis TaxID=1808979 RepID=A0A5Q0BLZ4_9GAMM|nr:hydrogenase formation protein HypD [Candidatus Methylospira mobilis]QFY44853.1 hydrogenase formation protein HypD [Candidatus Methylospira mobilis]WNV05603.1 hydrogenase formation protein HypD [Candidatus Methylospira mobilis]